MALVGIARLAAGSQVLESKRAVEYLEIPTRSILNRTKPNMPFQWTINPYRGCEIGCKYCYARYTHEFMELDPFSFEDRIYAKTAPAVLLRQELAKIDKRDHIAIESAGVRRLLCSLQCVAILAPEVELITGAERRRIVDDFTTTIRET